MTKRDQSGSFELMVMLVLIRLGDYAYGVPISIELEKRTGCDVAIGNVYAALERLEDRVSSVPTRRANGRTRRSGEKIPPRYRQRYERTAGDAALAGEAVARVAGIGRRQSIASRAPTVAWELRFVLT